MTIADTWPKVTGKNNLLTLQSRPGKVQKEKERGFLVCILICLSHRQINPAWIQSRGAPSLSLGTCATFKDEIESRLFTLSDSCTDEQSIFHIDSLGFLTTVKLCPNMEGREYFVCTLGILSVHYNGRTDIRLFPHIYSVQA